MQLQKEKRVPSNWKLQITEHYLQLHSICNTNIQATGPFVHLRIAEGYWEQWLYNHRQFFKDKKHKNDIAWSSYLWDPKQNRNQIPKLIWSIARFAPG